MKKVVGVLLAFLASLSGGAATAQTSFPDRPVHVLVGFVPGGPNDIIARAVGDRLAVLWGQPVIIENIPGATGAIAAERVAKATPDGYTLLHLNVNQIAVVPKLLKKLNFDPAKDLAPITLIATTPNVLTIPNEVPVHSVQELVAYLRAAPGKYTFGSAGVGTSQHLSGEQFKLMAKVDIQHVPYRGSAAVITDLLGNRLTMFFSNIAPITPLIREGRVRGLAVTSRQRFPSMPALPTMVESGFPDYEATAMFGFVAATGTPAGVIDKISSDTRKALAQDDLRRKLSELGVVIVGNSPAEFSAVIRSESERWAKVLKEAGLGVQQ